MRLGEPLEEIVHLDFQSGPSATKHADLLVYNALLYRQYLVPVHSIQHFRPVEGRCRQADGNHLARRCGADMKRLRWSSAEGGAGHSGPITHDR